jgi:ankyrin repeat protein
LKLLIDAGADINQRLPGGSTLLSSAIKRKEIDFAKALIEAGADYTLTISFGKSAYDLAKEAGLDELVALMDAQAVQ